MKPSLKWAIAAACIVAAARPAGAQATAAVSRLVTQYAGLPSASRIDSRVVTQYADLPSATSAVSRLVAMYADLPGGTLSVSRLVTEFAPEALGTMAVSRLTTSWIGYHLQSAVDALRISSGLHPASAREQEILNVVGSGASATVVDILDVYRVLVYVLHPETLP